MCLRPWSSRHPLRASSNLLLRRRRRRHPLDFGRRERRPAGRIHGRIRRRKIRHPRQAAAATGRPRGRRSGQNDSMFFPGPGSRSYDERSKAQRTSARLGTPIPSSRKPGRHHKSKIQLRRRTTQQAGFRRSTPRGRGLAGLAGSAASHASATRAAQGAPTLTGRWMSTATTCSGTMRTEARGRRGKR